MKENELAPYLERIVHTLDNIETPENSEEVCSIRKQVQGYQLGLQRVRTKEMVACILGGLEALTPQIDALVLVRDTEPDLLPPGHRAE